MLRLELVVAVGPDDECAYRPDAAGEQPQHIERGLVRPVQVVGDKHGSRAGVELTRQRRHDVVRRSALCNDLLGRSAYDLADSEQRAERPRSEERVAGAPEHAAGLIRTEATEQCGLAASG